jgi:hypothetical protein
VRGRSHHHLRGRANVRPKAWHERAVGAKRLDHDRALVSTSHPTLSHRIDAEAGRVHLEGVLIYRAECGIPTEVEVRVDFPFNYPRGEPRAFDVGGRFLPHNMDRHFATEDGCCCLWLPPKSRWNPLDPDTLVTFLDEVVVFFDRQLVYDAGGQAEWPGDQYAHGAPGYKEWIIEEFGGDAVVAARFTPVFNGTLRVGRNDRCLCEGGIKFKRCHAPVVERVRRGIEPSLLRDLFHL